ncbi:hypothetical protein QDX25_07255 [Auritidibacter ignavus]|uniref:hypothetical protein n=1 Tax=Auritidibacter ignavus TaxID=678932 RepID=UPI002446B736|nr:hypothetical protein [Auritidibacter ignavus]WGH80605.1 hypothetical protein QDX25_07255 [Auritidibacter ignavus]
MGTSRYVPVPAGLKEVGAWASVQASCVGAARQIASTAGSQGYSTYQAAPMNHPVGKQGDIRAGAVVMESDRDWRDVRDKRLLQVAEAMGRRG